MLDIHEAGRLSAPAYYAVEARDGPVGFGSLVAPQPAAPNAELTQRGHRGVRAFAEK